jgi:putative effector of murein hydrolase LrgA (UPF0299 family)
MTAMRLIRTILAAGFIVVGIVICSELVHYPIASTFPGFVLALAMIALGIVRLRALYERSGRQ